MFADDTKIWARIQKLEDKDSLQYDLDKLVEWSKQWLLAFNPEKCKVMHIGHDLPTKYTMNTEDKVIQLEDITTEKDLGIWITRDLKPRNNAMHTVGKESAVSTGNGETTFQRNRQR